MSRSLPNPTSSQEVRSYEGIRPKAVKAGLRQSDALGSHRTGSDFRHGPKIWDALVRGHGSVNATAITMGQTDPTQLKREVTLGTIRLKKFFEADEAALCEFAEYVLDTFQPARKSAKQIAKERLPELLGLMLAALEEG